MGAGLGEYRAQNRRQWGLCARVWRLLALSPRGFAQPRRPHESQGSRATEQLRFRWASLRAEPAGGTSAPAASQRAIAAGDLVPAFQSARLANHGADPTRADQWERPTSRRAGAAGRYPTDPAAARGATFSLKRRSRLEALRVAAAIV